MKIVTPQVRIAPLASPPPVAATRASVEVRIDTLLLNGFARSEGHRAAAALQRELTRLVTADGLPEIASTKHIDAGAIRAAARPELTGVRAARAIHGGLRA